MSFVLLSLFSILLFLAGSCGITLPQSICLYKKWNQTHKSTHFSTMIVTFILSFFLLATAFKIGINLALDYTVKAMHALSGTWFLEIVPILGILSLVSISHSLLIPKGLHFFNRWKTTNRPIYFSLVVLFAAATFFCFAWIYLAIFNLG